MLGVYVNFFTIVIGGIIGTLLKGVLKERFNIIATQGMGLCVMVIGISGAIKTNDPLCMIVSVAIGAFLGELINIERGLDNLGNYVQNKLIKGDTGFAAGFVNATLIFLVGAMAVMGSLEAGLLNKPDILLAKAMIDGVTSIALGSTFGIGVAFSAIPVTIYQGGIALLSGALASGLTEQMINELSAVGSLLIMGISINMLGLGKTKIRVGNMIPAMFIPILYIKIYELIMGVIK